MIKNILRGRDLRYLTGYPYEHKRGVILILTVLNCDCRSVYILCQFTVFEKRRQSPKLPHAIGDTGDYIDSKVAEDLRQQD